MGPGGAVLDRRRGYAAAVDPACVMAFPAPTGLLAGPAIAERLAGAPRRTSVALTERRVARPAPDLRVLGSRARGRRQDAAGAGAAPYEAYCTSVYRRVSDRTGDDGWRLVPHQQTPVA